MTTEEDHLNAKKIWSERMNRKQKIQEVKNKSPAFVDKAGRVHNDDKKLRTNDGVKINRPRTPPIEWHPKPLPEHPDKIFCKASYQYVPVCNMPVCVHMESCKRPNKPIQSNTYLR